MIYYLYEIKNNLNNKIYVGVHKTNDMNDGYMGSGKVINSAIAKYGIDNFTKTVLEEFNTAEEMFAREKEVVTDEFLLREDVYNLRRGGTGGFDYINNNKDDTYYKARIQNGKKNYIYGVQFTNDDNPNNSNNMKSRWKNDNTKLLAAAMINLELANSESSLQKKKITYEINAHSKGENNSQFNTMWITNGIENTKIKKDFPIPEGWKKGRIMVLSSNSRMPSR